MLSFPSLPDGALSGAQRAADLGRVVGAHGHSGHGGPVVELPVGQVAPDQAPRERLAQRLAARLDRARLSPVQPAVTSV